MTQIAENKKARFDYEIGETIIAGVVLGGHEAKSAKLGRMDLSGSHVIVRGGEAFLIGSSIHPFQPKNIEGSFDISRTRKLLFSKKELQELSGKLQNGFSLIPLNAFTHRGFIKVTIGIARGKKKADKRETIKKRETDREIRREIKK